MKVVVMGTGLAGVTTAWFLARDGHEVVVIDREPEVAAAASYPGALDYVRARVRACQRLMTPETTPRFGAGRFQNLWFNIGLGHMGFAMAAGAARITADLVAGRTPVIDLEGLRIRRH